MTEPCVNDPIRLGGARPQAVDVFKAAAVNGGASDAKRLRRRIGPRESRDLVAGVQQILNDGGADEACGASDEDLTDRPLKFWSVYSYLVVYDPAGEPLTIVAVLHGARDVARILTESG